MEKKMYHLSKEVEYHCLEVVIFDNLTVVKEYQQDGYTLEGTFELELIQGREVLPEYLEKT